MSPATLRRGWCPGVLRPMPTGDGLLVRLRLTSGELSGRLAADIAGLAERYGNGAIDLTQRANLQLRGVREDVLPALTAALGDLDLLDPSDSAESVRNMMVSPLAGIDPFCADGRALAKNLETILLRKIALHALPAKFGFAVDGGGLWPLGDVGADITLIAPGPGDGWRIRLGGSPSLSQPIEAAEATGQVARLAQIFLSKSSTAGFRRMRDLVANDGAANIFSEAGLLVSNAGLAVGKRATPEAGGHRFSADACIAAIGLPFGRIEASKLKPIAALAGPRAALRLTPWRLLIVRCADEAAVTAILAKAPALGLVTTPGDVRLAIDACTGAPGCVNATTPTREDAILIAGVLGQDHLKPGTIHVSGCIKGCARRGTARVTLVGRDGRYDLVVNGGPSDAPVRTAIACGDLAAAVRSALAVAGGAA